MSFLQSIHTSTGEDMREHCNDWGKKIVALFVIYFIHMTDGYSVLPLHTDLTPEYSWGSEVRLTKSFQSLTEFFQQ